VLSPDERAKYGAKLRVDKWLWAARFFKTRSLATTAVEGGKVLVNGARVKPAKTLKPGDELFIRTPGFEYTVKVAALSDRRGPAAEAAKLFVESEENQRKREEAKLTRIVPEPTAFIRGRPTKKARRQLQRFREDG
jgi:ribosome-associated heat shock protein Hsp15